MNRIEALASAAERNGPVALPLLTQADMCALGAACQSLICKRTWTWWTGLADSERENLTAKSLDILAMRRLLTPAGGSGPAVPAPELGLILAARARPQVIVTCQVPGSEAAFEPRFFGITAERGGLRALVRETLTTDTPGPGDRADLGTTLQYTLMNSYDAADAMAAWARSRRTVTMIDVFRHGVGGRPVQDRFEIRPDGDRYDVRCPAGGIPPGRHDRMELRQTLARALAGASR